LAALSAAVAMYRAALEQLLFEQGYRKGMLARKIEILFADEDPPEWLRDLDPEYLSVIKDLGNAPVHPNEGHNEKQRTLDEGVLLQLRALFVELLDDIYEQPEARAARLAVLRAAREGFKPPSRDEGAGTGSAGPG
jgi:hypothetical protein